MKNALATLTTPTSQANKDFLTVYVNKQIFGIPVLQVQDVLGPQKVTRVPLAPPEIAGSLNLRGRIVTAIDVRKRLKLPDAAADETKSMSVVVDMDGELYSLIFDAVGDVLSLSQNQYEPTPSTLDAVWKSVSTGIYRLDSSLLVILNIEDLIKSLDDQPEEDSTSPS